MAEIAAKHSAELKPRSNRDDYFITGFLRERLPWVSLRSGEVLWRSPCIWISPGSWRAGRGARCGTSCCPAAPGSASPRMSSSTTLWSTRAAAMCRMCRLADRSTRVDNISTISTRVDNISTLSTLHYLRRGGGCTSASSGSSTSWAAPSGWHPAPSPPPSPGSSGATGTSAWLVTRDTSCAGTWRDTWQRDTRSCQAFPHVFKPFLNSFCQSSDPTSWRKNSIYSIY